jgi:hypothetical protein
MFEVMQKLEDGTAGREGPQEIAALVENCAKLELQVRLPGEGRGRDLLVASSAHALLLANGLRRTPANTR